MSKFEKKNYLRFKIYL